MRYYLYSIFISWVVFDVKTIFFDLVLHSFAYVLATHTYIPHLVQTTGDLEYLQLFSTGWQSR